MQLEKIINQFGKVEDGQIVFDHTDDAADTNFDQELPDPCSFHTYAEWTRYRLWPVACRHHQSGKRWVQGNRIKAIGPNSLLIRQPGGVVREFNFEDVRIDHQAVRYLREKLKEWTLKNELRQLRIAKREVSKLQRQLEEQRREAQRQAEWNEKKRLQEEQARTPIDLGKHQEEFEALKLAVKQAKADEDAAEALWADAKTTRMMNEARLLKFADEHGLEIQQ